jgi:hypothetical protein
MTVSTQRFTEADASRIGTAIGIDWTTSPFDAAQFLMGLHVEPSTASTTPRRT